ncbi:transcriptional regulator [Desulfosporosinus acidiphilus SJ4]|uniref:Transcriptional regulator n=1 Tax=Desulfosporosinus acidiphilus (strain DSM 22704 / JCM 16185 / SJ4) TaxID=646529 RepID=I4D6M9_DESAJ|nr:TetR/AcrR family transcriptional regulator [Desulfosporosinus acidiphilus]AFM41453.1 transcriptional regulator [Desulfosporosinus acidiphilus SJ4]
MKSKEKLQLAAAQLFMKNGYENTTVQEIASLAGVTERTFFRQFKDKSDVLFDSSNTLGQRVAAFITDNFEVERKPLKLAVGGFATISEFFDGSRERVLARNQIIQSNPDLQERELLKRQVLIESVINALSVKYDIELSELAARFSVEIFHIAFKKWIKSDEKSFAEQVLDVYALYEKLITSPVSLG